MQISFSEISAHFQNKYYTCIILFCMYSFECYYYYYSVSPFFSERWCRWRVGECAGASAGEKRKRKKKRKVTTVQKQQRGRFLDIFVNAARRPTRWAATPTAQRAAQTHSTRV
jgi:hypothetical protein